MRPYLILFALLLCAFQLKAQQETFEPALMPAKFGAKLVYTSDKHSFTLDIVSKNLKPDAGLNMIQVDGKIIQFNIIPQKADDDKVITAEQEKTFLTGYVDYELKYVKNELKLDIKNVEQHFFDINGKPVIVWFYDMPANYKTVSKQLNVSSIHFGQVLTLNSPIESGTDIKAYKETLVRIAGTIKESNSAVDLNKLYEELQKD